VLTALLLGIGAAEPASVQAADAAALRESLTPGARGRALRELEADPRLDPLARAQGLDTGRGGLRLGMAAEDRLPSAAKRAPVTGASLQFQDDPEPVRRVRTLTRNGLPLFPVRKGLMDGDLVFGVSRRGTLGVFLTPRTLD
jgi:hypothetical protein